MLSSDHTYPAFNGVSFGRHPKEFSSGSGHHLQDLLARGLNEAGHEVLYYLPRGAAKPLPPGIQLISKPDIDVDVYHNMAFRYDDVIQHMEDQGVPWVTTCHVDRSTRSEPGWNITRNWIFVSRTLARSQGSARFVLNGIDPGDFVYSAVKQDYLLFISAVERAWDKGLDMALAVSQSTGRQLVVAGTAGGYPLINRMADVCREHGARYVGDVQGSKKADLFAGAAGMLFPTKLNEAFGLVIIEALMSGTPVICSSNGACSEIVTPEVGFVCNELDEYVAAVGRLHEIRPEACRNLAMERYHYRRMTADYVKEYEAEIAFVNRTR
jgi:glycosyltransferase involved in cell wall biosynthesis